MGEESETQECPDCGESFHQLGVHRGVVHHSKPHILCHLCGLSFQRQKHLDKHSTRHASSKIKCFVCKCKFEHSKSLFRHIEQHERLHVFKCKHCSSSYALGKHYEKHVRIKHGGEVDVGSSLCDNKLNVGHSGSQPVSSTCNNISDNLLTLDINKGIDVSVDIGEETMNKSVNVARSESSSDCMSIADSFCALCNQLFENILTHISIVHCYTKPLLCNLCGFITHKEKIFQKHLKTHSSDGIVCCACKVSLDDVRSLLRHIEEHKELHLYKCKDCSQTYALEKHYSRHVRKKHGAISLSVNHSLNRLSTENNFSVDPQDGNRDAFINVENDTASPLKNKSIKVVDDRKSKSKSPVGQGRPDKRIKLSSNECKVEASDKENGNFKKRVFRWKDISTSDKSISLTELFENVENDLGNPDVDPDIDWTCFECKMFFGPRVFLHYFEEHNGGSPCCPICSKEYHVTSKPYLYRHLMKHKDLYRWRCQTCGSKFCFKFDLFRHVTLAHDKLERFTCELCGEKYIYYMTFKAHLRSHRDPEHLEKFECPHCSSKYTYKKDLTAHTRPSECRTCDTKFICRSFYNKHFEDYHRKNRTFDCPHCDRSYILERSLDTHMTKKHFDFREKDKIFKCQLCSYITHHTKNLARHKRHYHNDN